jgi:hypothetical protein
VHRGATWLDSCPHRERCQRGNSQDHQYWTSSIQQEIPWAENMKAKPSDDAAKNQETSSFTAWVNYLQFKSKVEVPSWTHFFLVKTVLHTTFY